MPRLIEKSTGKSWEIASDDLDGALASGLYEVPAGTTARVVDKQTGLAGDVAATELTRYRDASRSVHAQSDTEFREAENKARIDREHGGALGTAGAFVEGAVDTATLGGYGAVTRAILPDSYTENRRERAQANPVASTAGTVVGAVAPSLLSGGTGAAAAAARATPMGAAARVGVKTAERLGGGIKGAAAGFAAEGALVGVGTGVQELTLSEDPITVERAASVIGSNVLFGAGVGGAVGGGGAAAARIASKAVNKSKELVDAVRARASVADDLRGLDAAGLRVEREKAIAELGAERLTQKASVAEEIKAYRTAIDEANPWLVAEGESRKVLTSSKNRLRSILDEPVGLAENPKRALDTLRRNAQGLKRAIDEAPEMAERLAKEETKLVRELALDLETLPASAAGVQLEGKLARRYADWSGNKVGKAGATVAPDEAARFRAALESGEVQGARAAALPKLQGTLDQNLALQQKILDLDAPLASQRLTAIDEAKDALTAGGKRGMVENTATGYALTAAAGLLPGGPLGAIGAMVAPQAIRKAADLVFGRLSKATAAAAERTKAAVDAFVSVGTKLARPTPVLATKVLASLSYAPAGPRMRGEAAPTKRTTLAGAYQAREREILSQVSVSPDGGLAMKPSARRALGERLAGIRVLSPMAADRIETVAARKLEFLAEKLPKRPDIVGMAPGPDRWQPSDMQMRAFARYAIAVEDPGGVEERLAHGSVTPEDAEAYRTVYPERFEALKQDIMARLPELRETLPRERRLALSIFTGIPVDPSLHPAVLRVLQSTFPAEPGTEGGTQPARAQPNFGPLGSMRKEDPTPAQEAAG